MSDTSKIEWTEATWNPTVGCTHVSPGCDNCYAARLASGRLQHQLAYAGLAEGGKFNGTVRTLAERLGLPLRWRRPRRIFVNSMSDLFHDKVSVSFIAEVFAVMAAAHWHTFQIPSKRHGRMRNLLKDPDFREMVKTESATLAHEGIDVRTNNPWENWPLPNVWLGVSAETQRWADIRIPALLDTPAAVRFVSAEPLLGPVDLSGWMGALTCGCGGEPGGPAFGCSAGCMEPVPGGLDWVITGGESGQGARHAPADWFRAIRDQCTAAGVAYFHKQNGNKRYGRELDGRTWDEYPQAVPHGR